MILTDRWAPGQFYRSLELILLALTPREVEGVVNLQSCTKIIDNRSVNCSHKTTKGCSYALIPSPLGQYRYGGFRQCWTLSKTHKYLKPTIFFTNSRSCLRQFGGQCLLFLIHTGTFWGEGGGVIVSHMLNMFQNNLLFFALPCWGGT